MFDLVMFLGFPLQADFAQASAHLDPKLTRLFTAQNEEYLREVVYQNEVYWGKSIGEICDVDKLELLEKNVYSLLKKIVPDYPYGNTCLYLFPLVAKAT